MMSGLVYGMIATGCMDAGWPFWKAMFWPTSLAKHVARKIAEEQQ